jgi:hypothetical protein
MKNIICMPAKTAWHAPTNIKGAQAHAPERRIVLWLLLTVLMVVVVSGKILR